MYVTGWSSDYVTVKYDAEGNELWLMRYDGAGGQDRSQGIALDAKGNVYVTGWSEDATRHFDYAIIKYSQSPPNSPAPRKFSPHR